MQISIGNIKNILLAAVLTGGIGFAQSTPPPPATAGGHQADQEANGVANVNLATPAPSGIAPTFIKWNETSVTTSATAQDRIINQIFTFTNTDNKAVRITNVEASCGCTHATFSPTTVNPGKNGTVTLSIALKGRREPFNITAAVTFSDVASPEVLKCTIIPYGFIHVEPRILTWERSEQRSPKTVIVDLSHATDLILEKSSTLSDESFSINSEHDQQNNLWKLSVLPKSGAPKEEVLMLSFVNAKNEKRQFFLALKAE